MNDEERELLLRRLAREKRARRRAEALVEHRSRALHQKDQELVRLAASERTARQDVEILRAALDAFASTLDEAEITHRLQKLLEVVAPHDGGAIYLASGERLRVATAFGQALPGVAVGDEVAASSGPDDGVTASVGEGGESFRATLDMGAHGGATGRIVLERRGARRFDAHELRLAQGLANEAAVALHSARLFAEVQRLATTDPLTGLLNRRAFTAAASIELQRALRHGRPLSMVMLDLDHFKRVNDTHGHAAGDLVLLRAAECCVRQLRATDLVARLGGEELCLLLPETGLAGATTAAERVRRALCELEFGPPGGVFRISGSFGVTERDGPDDTLEQLLRRSDAALYEAKRDGRDRVRTMARPRAAEAPALPAAAPADPPSRA